jgi:hypothetical protein
MGNSESVRQSANREKWTRPHVKTLRDAINGWDAEAALKALETAEGRAEILEPSVGWLGRSCVERVLLQSWVDGGSLAGKVIPAMLAALDGAGRERALLAAIESDKDTQRNMQFSALAHLRSVFEQFCLSSLPGGAKLSARAADGKTALHLAARNADAELVAWLLPHCDANALDAEGKTALMIAAAHSEGADCVAALLPAADAKLADALGRTALMAAARKGEQKSVEALLPVSNPEARDTEGRTALWIALERQGRRPDTEFVMDVSRAIDQGVQIGDGHLRLLVADNPAFRAAKALAPKTRAASDPTLAADLFTRAASFGNFMAADLFADHAPAAALARAIAEAERQDFGGAMPRARAALERAQIVGALSAPTSQAASAGEGGNEAAGAPNARRPRI